MAEALNLDKFATYLGGYNVIVPYQTYRSFMISDDLRSDILKTHTICLASDLSLMQAANSSYSTYCALVKGPMRIDDDGNYVILRHIKSGRIRIAIENHSSIDYLTLLSELFSPFLLRLATLLTTRMPC